MTIFLGLAPEEYSYESARVIVVPVPFEASVSYGSGTAGGPQAILEASCQVEFLDALIDRDYTGFGIYTLEPMVRTGDYRIMADHVHKTIRRIILDAKFPVLLGGEHSVSIPALEAFHSLHPDCNVIHIDAHADLRDQYQGNPVSHACVCRRIHEMGIKVLSIGIRSFCSEERLYAQKHSIPLLHPESNEFWDRLDTCLKKISGPAWLTFDVDGLDPAIMPATGTPEPGGLLWGDVTRILLAVKNSNMRILGCDIVELAPVPGLHHADFTAAKLAYRIMLVFATD